MIRYVKFRNSVTIGGREHEVWSAKEALTSAHHGKITVEERPGFNGLIVRFVAGAVRDVIRVPWGNIAQITEDEPDPQDAKAKK